MQNNSRSGIVILGITTFFWTEDTYTKKIKIQTQVKIQIQLCTKIYIYIYNTYICTDRKEANIRYVHCSGPTVPGTQFPPPTSRVIHTNRNGTPSEYHRKLHFYFLLNWCLKNMMFGFFLSILSK